MVYLNGQFVVFHKGRDVAEMQRSMRWGGIVMPRALPAARKSEASGVP